MMRRYTGRATGVGKERLRVLAVVAFVACMCLNLLADSARAGTVGVNGRIQGAGSISSFEGGPYGCSRTGNQNDRVTAECPREAFGAVFSAFVKLRATPSPTPANHWFFVRWEGCQAVTNDGLDCEVNSGAFSLDERFPKAIFDDRVAPTITSGPTESFSTTTDKTAAFFFGANEGVDRECRFDSEVFSSACSSGISRTFSTEGSHTIHVRAIDPSGNVGPPASRTFAILDTALSGGPPQDSLTNATTATFNYSSVAGNQFECQLDGGGFSSCGTGTTSARNLSGLGDGVHVFEVRSRQGEFFDRLPATRRWRVDSTPPNTEFTESPAEGLLTTLVTANFSFTNTEPSGGSFQCSHNGAPFAACTSPRTLTGLTARQHTFEVRAVDAAGNPDPTPVKRTWTITLPDVDNDGFNVTTDCNDGDPLINPGRPEVINNEADENCDGVVALDRDNDGVQPPADCDDNNAARAPGKPEILDNDVDEDCNGSPLLNMDRDGDGAQRPADCDDSNPNARPGAFDIPGNAVDEDCVNGPAAKVLEVLPGSVSYDYRASRRGTTFRRFVVKGLPTGTTVTATCKGKGCPPRFSKRNVSGTVSIKPLLSRRIPVGRKITVTATKAGMIGSVKIITIGRKRPATQSLCLQPGAKQPSACP